MNRRAKSCEKDGQKTPLEIKKRFALEALNLKKAGLHAFRRGCNRRWELAGIVPAVIRQQMGHTGAAMTRLYSGEIPMEHVQAAFSPKNRRNLVQLENMENEAAA
jgi:integrase